MAVSSAVVSCGSGRSAAVLLASPSRPFSTYFPRMAVSSAVVSWRPEAPPSRARYRATHSPHISREWRPVPRCVAVPEEAPPSRARHRAAHSPHISENGGQFRGGELAAKKRRRLARVTEPPILHIFPENGGQFRGALRFGRSAAVSALRHRAAHSPHISREWRSVPRCVAVPEEAPPSRARHRAAHSPHISREWRSVPRW